MIGSQCSGARQPLMATIGNTEKKNMCMVSDLTSLYCHNLYGIKIGLFLDNNKNKIKLGWVELIFLQPCYIFKG